MKVKGTQIAVKDLVHWYFLAHFFFPVCYRYKFTQNLVSIYWFSANNKISWYMVTILTLLPVSM